MTKRLTLALCVTTLLGGTQSVHAEGIYLFEEEGNAKHIVIKQSDGNSFYCRAENMSGIGITTAAKMGSNVFLVNSKSEFGNIPESHYSEIFGLYFMDSNVAYIPAPSQQNSSVAPKPMVVAAPQIQPRKVPEVVRAAPSVQKVSLLQAAQQNRDESIVNQVVVPVVQDPAPVEEAKVTPSLPNPLYDDVEEVSPIASSGLSNSLPAWEGLASLLSGKEPLSESCYKTEVNTDDPILIDINNQVHLLTHIPQENGGEPLLNYANLFHTMSPDDFERELSQHQQSVKKAAELSLALQDYEKNAAGDPNRLEQVKQVGQSLLNRAQSLVDLGVRFDHLSRKRKEEAQLSSAQYPSVSATSQVEEREVKLSRSSSSPSLDDLKDSLNELMKSEK